MSPHVILHLRYFLQVGAEAGSPCATRLKKFLAETGGARYSVGGTQSMTFPPEPLASTFLSPFPHCIWNNKTTCPRHRLYKLLRTEGPTARLEKAVTRGIEHARGKPQSFHGIPLRSLSPSSWGSASRLLKAVGSFTLPSDKVTVHLTRLKFSACVARDCCA